MVRPFCKFTPPAWSKDSGLAVRNHNKLVKDAIRATLERHWRKNTRKHFQYGSGARYQYFPRSMKYRRYKLRKFGHQIDMLFSGATRRKMTEAVPLIRVGGAAVGGKSGPTGRYFLRFPFGGGSEPGKPRRISRRILDQLRKEVARWADDEIKDATEFFLSHYMNGLSAFSKKRGRGRPRKA